MSEYRLVNPPSLSQWFESLEMQAEIFNKTPNFFYETSLRNRFFKLENVFIMLYGERVVSHVQVFPSLFNIGGVFIWGGGIGGVSTRPEHRGKGLATSLLEASIRYMEVENLPISVLYTTKYSFYGRLGWSEVVELSNFQPSPSDLKKFDIGSYTYTPLSEFDEMSSLIEIYNKNNVYRPLSRRRSPSDWILQCLMREPFKEDLSLSSVQLKDNIPVGYMRIGYDKKSSSFFLLEAFSDSHEGYSSLLSYIGREAESIGCKSIKISLPEDHPLVSILLESGFTRETVKPGFTMFRINSLKGLLADISHYKKVEEWSGKLCLKTDKGLSDVPEEVYIEIDEDGNIHILEEPPTYAAFISAPRELWNKVICNMITPQKMAEDPRVTIEGDPITPLYEIFNKSMLRPYPWILDRF